MGDGLDAGAVAAGKIFAHGVFAERESGVKVGQRAQDEGTFANAGVRQGEARVVKVQVVVAEQVEVEGARRIFVGAFAALLVFDGLQQVEQR